MYVLSKYQNSITDKCLLEAYKKLKLSSQNIVLKSSDERQLIIQE